MRWLAVLGALLLVAASGCADPVSLDVTGHRHAQSRSDGRVTYKCPKDGFDVLDAAVHNHQGHALDLSQHRFLVTYADGAADFAVERDALAPGATVTVTLWFCHPTSPPTRLSLLNSTDPESDILASADVPAAA